MSDETAATALGEKKRVKTSRDWVSKTLAGISGGFGLGIALSGLFAFMTPGALDEPNKLQIVMWLVPPVWIGVMSAAFAMPDGRRAWLWLAAANAAAFSLLALIRFFSH